MARSQFGAVAAAPAEVLAQLQRRASLLGRDAPALVIGSTTGGTARCQLFVLQTGVAIKDIRLIEFRARQNQASDNARCFEAKPAADSFATLLNPSTGGCAINWSGWQSATLVEDGRGIAIVAGVFKNWSHDRTRTGQLWVWYASGFAPAAPRNLRIVP
jgi:hypothetical protein